MPEVAGGAAIHFDPYSVEAIRHSIEGIVTDTEARQTLIQKGLERARKFSWERCARETATVYRNVCGISASATSEAAIKRVAKPSPL
jgi:glycosyltransferase involved in cell wall biosynthesis